MNIKTRQKSWLFESIFAAFPICIGYLPLGLACGILGQKVGLTPFDVGLMSIIVFAGSSQFIAVSMIGLGSSISSIVMSVFIVNLRHILLSSNLSKHFTTISKRKLFLFSHSVTDETFAINENMFHTKDWDYKRALTVNQISHFTWIISNVLGCIVGPVIAIKTDIFDYTLIAMFIGLLSFQLKNKKYILIGCISGILSIIFSFYLENNLHIIVATTIAATIGFFAEEFNFNNQRIEGDTID